MVFIVILTYVRILNNQKSDIWVNRNYSKAQSKWRVFPMGVNLRMFGVA